MQQDNLFTEQAQTEKQTGPVTCLGKTFANNTERRTYFTELLAEKLKEPEFRKIEGFPIGSDEDILNLSDPPYYTACPNPWIADFIAQWEAEKPAQPEGYHYHREPFAADVSEGKNDPIYNAHSYHTKVPHKAIMRYILHYTNPGDIVFDGFCGTGMTGVAAQMCGDKNEVLSLGYQVKADGTILKQEIDSNNHKIWVAFSELGIRRCILNDLSPVASFISSNYNRPLNVDDFSNEVSEILDTVEDELSWMLKTRHKDNVSFGTITQVVWSDVFICPQCQNEVVFWDVAVNQELGTVADEFSCSSCGVKLKKKAMERAYLNLFDKKLNETILVSKQVPVLIKYTFDNKRFSKLPDEFDLKVLEDISNYECPYWYPSDRMIFGKETRRNDVVGMTHVHHFYSSRNLFILAAIRDKCKSSASLLWFNSQLINLSKLNRFRPGVSFPYNPLSGTYYVGSLVSESSVFIAYRNKLKNLVKAFKKIRTPNIIGTSSTTSMEGASFDYIFLDPPFGANLNYSELSSLWEKWLKVETCNTFEAIENSTQSKSAVEYRDLMTKCFVRAYEMLKPGRWITVEFSNTKSSVWNSIQSALNQSGFIVANVSALDKQQGSFKAVTTSTAVKQDLIISAYKPNDGFEERFSKEAFTEDGVWDFIRTHLQYLPVVKLQGNSLLQIPERDPRILFDQVVAYYVRKGYHLPVSSLEFQAGLAQRFVERDGMYFLDEQAAEYDKKKAVVGELVQISLFVKDEASAIQWIRQLLKLKPQVFSDINPLFMQQLSGWSKNEVQLDLRELLKDNFLCYDGRDEVPEQIHSYLSSNWKELRNLAKTTPELKAKAKDRWYVPDPNKAGDLEKLRERSLLKEFEEYKTAKKKLKVFRIEAVRAGFKKLWEAQEFASILDISTKLPNDVIAEDPILLMYYDQAMMLSQNNSTEDW